MTIRKPAVAGRFYPADKEALRQAIGETVVDVPKKIKAQGIVSPHAGYPCSGPVAGILYSHIEIPPTAVILGPNHNGIGEPYAIMTTGDWATPLGKVPISRILAEDIKNSSELIAEDTLAHQYEHSLEVQVPFLQYWRPDIKIVPIVIGGDRFEAIGKAIAGSIKKSKTDCLIVASSDMTHYQPQEAAQRKDKLALDAILDLDEKEMISRIVNYDISMCGYGPVAIMLIAAKLLGARKAELIKYMTSGDTTGDYSAVVGYAGLAVF